MRRSLLSLFALASADAEAGPLLWNDNSLSYLYGQHFKVDGTGDDTPADGELRTRQRLDLGRRLHVRRQQMVQRPLGWRRPFLLRRILPTPVSGQNQRPVLSFGIVKDVLIAATYERGEDRNRKYLLGPAVDLALPGFDRFSLNTYYRKPDGITGKASGQWQINPTWSMTLPVGRSDILFDGYLEWYVNDVGNKGTSNYVGQELALQSADQIRRGQGAGATAEAVLCGDRVGLLVE